MNLFENAYDYIKEAVSHEPNYVKLMKWAISVHFNSGSSMNGDQETPMPSRIGYYFSTIRFQNWATNYEPDVGKFAPLALFYNCNCKTFVGKQEVAENRQFTIVYAVQDIEGLKEEIATNKTIAKCFRGPEPAPSFDKELPAELHRIAEEHVFYAKFFWRNDEQDAIVIGPERLANLGPIIKNSEFATGKVEVFRDRQARGKKNDFRHDTGLYTTISLDRRADFMRKIFGTCVNKPYIEITLPSEKEKGKTRVFHAAMNNYSDLTTVDDTRNNLLYIGVSPDDYGDAVRYKMAQEGFKEFDKWKEISLLTKSGKGVRKVGLGTSALKEAIRDIVFGISDSDGKKITKKSGEAAPRASGPATFACDSSSFARITQMANRMVAAYNNEHKASASVDVDNTDESVTITGMSAKALEQFTEILDKRGMKYSKM